MLSASSPSTDDPLAYVFAPPPNESEHERENRMRAEDEAKKRSDAIDEEINKQRITRKNRPVKILLLGQPTISFLRCKITHAAPSRSKRVRCAP